MLDRRGVSDGSGGHGAWLDSGHRWFDSRVGSIDCPSTLTRRDGLATILPPMNGDLLIRNVRPMAGVAVDVLATGGVIARVGAGIAAVPGAEVVDGQHGILLPGFVDAHMHLDKTFWGLPWRAHEAGPSVLDRIGNERRLRRELGLAPDVQAEALARQAVSRGTLHIRSHVDVDTEIGLRNFEGVMAARSRLKDIVSIQVVAFPRAGSSPSGHRGAPRSRGAGRRRADRRNRSRRHRSGSEGAARHRLRHRRAPWRGRGHPSARPGRARRAPDSHDRRAHAGAGTRGQGLGQPRVLPRHGGRGRAGPPRRPARGQRHLDHDQCAGGPADAAASPPPRGRCDGVLRIGWRARCLDAVRHGGHARARHAARLSQRLSDRRSPARRARHGDARRRRCAGGRGIRARRRRPRRLRDSRRGRRSAS